MKISYKREVVTYNQDDIPDDGREVIISERRTGLQYVFGFYNHSKNLWNYFDIGSRHTDFDENDKFAWQEIHLDKE